MQVKKCSVSKLDFDFGNRNISLKIPKKMHFYEKIGNINVFIEKKSKLKTGQLIILRKFCKDSRLYN